MKPNLSTFLNSCNAKIKCIIKYIHGYSVRNLLIWDFLYSMHFFHTKIRSLKKSTTRTLNCSKSRTLGKAWESKVDFPAFIVLNHTIRQIPKESRYQEKKDKKLLMDVKSSDRHEKKIRKTEIKYFGITI